MRKPLLLLGSFVSWLIALLLIVSAGLPERAIYTGVSQGDGPRVAPEIGSLAPPFQAATLDGSIDSARLLGQPLLLNFWATWCAPCALEMAELQRLHETLQSAVVIGVNLGESASAVSAWAEAYHLTFDLVVDPGGSIARLYALRGQPSTYVIAPDGTIRHIFFGAADAAAFIEALLPLIG
ncbi:MAG: TlpA family protein disulfide reductase [Anaerolineae bacterium]|nr:TlpA family protein disulfide reductase [Anaerolineae bacterium]